MTSLEAARAAIDALEGLGIPYMLVGSFSSNYYGIPRSTKDVDIVLQLGEHSIREVAEKLGPGFKLDPQMTFETVTMTVRHVIEVAENSFVIELFCLSDEAHDQERFQRRQRVKLAHVA